MNFLVVLLFPPEVPIRDFVTIYVINAELSITQANRPLNRCNIVFALMIDGSSQCLHPPVLHTDDAGANTRRDRNLHHRSNEFATALNGSDDQPSVHENIDRKTLASRCWVDC